MTTMITVPGMMCQHCEKTIKGALSDLSGVQSVTVDLESKKVTVEHDQKVSPALLKETLMEIGYDTEG